MKDRMKKKPNSYFKNHIFQGLNLLLIVIFLHSQPYDILLFLLARSEAEGPNSNNSQS